MTEGKKVRRAIISVDDKSGVVDFARGLLDLGFEIYSTGRTKGVLDESGLKVHSVSELTNFPEILDGRVKTLHPAVHGGILARRDKPDHLEALAQHGIDLIDLVAVNLYPFIQAVSDPTITLENALEKIDIGGPTMVRAAAKNFPSVLIVIDPKDYADVLATLNAPPEEGSDLMEFRQQLAAKAFQHVAYYDTYVAQYLRAKTDHFPPSFTIALDKVQELRYGENPHQIAAFYSWKSAPDQKFASLATAKQIQGKELSYNNILDADTALNISRDFAAPTITIVKHANPCGIASHPNILTAYERAVAGDPISAYGGAIAGNRPLGADLAEMITSTFYEVIIAPAYTEEALEIFRKKKNLRLLETGDLSGGVDQIAMTNEIRPVVGGFLVQTRDALPERDIQLTVVTNREPTLEEVTNLQFAWRTVKHIKSNAIVVVKNHAVVGLGTSQANQLDAIKIALNKAGMRAQGAVLASDAFFPKTDCVEIAALHGISAIVQPGGSISDTEVVETAIKYNLAMVFSGKRHLRH
jgi:phosphoribosylaminoimidazolecarboxamide formyltransferase / IMP cyclohydrolase